MDTPNTELIRSHVDTIILCTLLDGDSYPYDILKEISDKTEDRYNLKQATLYSCMKRLEKKGLVSSYWGTESSGGRRRYYSLTDAGRQFVERDQTEWEYSRTIINRLLSDKEFDLEHGEAPFDVSSLRPLTRRESHEEVDDTTEDESIEKIPDNISEDECSDTNIDVPSTDSSPIGNNDDLLISTPYMQHRDKSYSESLSDSTSDNITDNDKKIEEVPSVALSDILSADFRDDEPTDADVRMLEASKRLNIGQYSLPYKLEEINENELVPVYDTSAATPQKPKSSDSDEDYIKKLDDLFTSEMTRPAEPEEKTWSNVQFNDLKNNLLKEGYRLRMYSRPTDISRFYQQYIYENKLRRDSYLILSLPLIVMAIVTLCLNIYSVLAVKIMLGIGVFGLPIVSTILCSLNIDKRVRNNYFFMYDFIIRLVVSLIAIVIMLVVFFTVPTFDIASNTAVIYMSVAYALTVPLYSVIKALLLKTKRYYV